MDTIDTSQSSGYLLGILIASRVVRLEELHSTIARIIESRPFWIFLRATVSKLQERMIEACTRIFIHLINQVHRGADTWEDNPLGIYIRLVIRVIKDIGARTTDSHLINNTTTQFLVEFIYLRSNITHITLVHQLLIPLYIGSKEGSEIWNTIDRTRLTILEEKKLIQ